MKRIIFLLFLIVLLSMSFASAINVYLDSPVNNSMQPSNLFNITIDPRNESTNASSIFFKDIRIYELTGNTQTDYPVRIRLLKEPSINSNFNNTNFSTLSGSLLNFTFEKINTTEATAWVKIPSLAGNQVTIIRFNYGSATQGYLNTSGTNVFTAYNGSGTLAGGAFASIFGSTTFGINTSLVGLVNFTSDTDIYQKGFGYNAQQISFGQVGAFINYYVGGCGDVGSPFIKIEGGGSSFCANTTAIAGREVLRDNTLYEIVRNSTGRASLYINRNFGNATTSSDTNAYNISLYSPNAGSGSFGWNFLAIRKALDVEPLVLIGGAIPVSLTGSVYSNLNATIFVWNNNGSVLNQTTTSISGNTSNATTFTITNLFFGTKSYNVYACSANQSNTIRCGFFPSNFSFLYGTINSNSFNATTFETAREGFLTNLTNPFSTLTISTANLIWNQSSYSGTIQTNDNTNYLLSRSIDIPLNAYGNVPWFWQITFSDGSQQNLTSQVQNVSQTILGLCNSSLKVPYINFTFKDETTNSAINGSIVSSSWNYWLGSGSVTKTLSFLNSTGNPSYAFCFSPADRTLQQNVSLQYSGTNYPQRSYFSSPNLTNITTNQTLYLLGSSSGIYSSILVVQGLGTNPIVGANVLVELLVGSTYVTVGNQNTDSSGIATFWLNPSSTYRYTVTADGYVSSQFTLTPSQAIYTVRLQQQISAGSVYNSSLAGYKWYVLPQTGLLQPGVQQFNLSLITYSNNLYQCRFSIVNSTSLVAFNSTTGGNSTGCDLSITYNLTDSQNIFGKLEINNTLTDGQFQIVDADWKWVTIDSQLNSTTTIINFFTRLGSLSEFGANDNRQEFSKIMFFFLITTILLSAFCYFSGFELQNPGVALLLLWFIIFIASIAGFFTFVTGSSNIQPWAKQYGLLSIYTVFSIGYLINYVRRQSA